MLFSEHGVVIFAFLARNFVHQLFNLFLQEFDCFHGRIFISEFLRHLLSHIVELVEQAIFEICDLLLKVEALGLISAISIHILRLVKKVLD